MDLDPYPLHVKKKKISKWIIDLNVKPKTIKLPEENMEKILYKKEAKKIFDTPPKT